MSLVAWRTYLEVCRTGSLSAAAHGLGYTQSAVSRQIAVLEQMAGVALLERHARGARPTAAGRAFRQHALRVVNESDRAVRAAREAAAGVRSIAIGAIPSAALGILPAALRDVGRQDPPRSWHLTTALTADLEARVASGELDAAIVSDAPPGLSAAADLSRRVIGTDEMRVLVGVDHPACGSIERRPLRSFASETWVEDNDGSAALLRSHAAKAGFDPRIEISTDDLSSKAAVVATGHAVALVPGLLTPALRPDVRAVRLIDPPKRGIVLTTAKARELQDLAVLAEALAFALRSASGSGALTDRGGPAAGGDADRVPGVDGDQEAEESGGALVPE